MKRHISIRSHILVYSLLVIFISLAIVFGASYYLVYLSLVNGRMGETVGRSEGLIVGLDKDRLENISNDEALSKKFDENASFVEGRILLVSRNYKVVKDTAGVKEGTYIINDDVMNVMNGNTKAVQKRIEHKVVVIKPVITDGEIIGAIVSKASLESTFNHMKKEFYVICIISMFVFLMDVFLINAISKSSVKDLNDINEQMQHTSQGNLQERLPSQKFAETESLAESYNEILSKLATIDQTRSEFVSNVSHELKTPITSMKVLAESITQNEGATVDDYKEFMTDIVDEIDRETKIINDLLTLVKTDSQNNVMNFEESSINEMMDVIIKTVNPLAKQRNISLEYESFREVMADVDQVKLSLAISNLVENAVKYNIDNGSVKASLNADHKYFYIKVSDTGVGIPDDAKDKVFERFYRVDKARSRDTGGTGLGLSITRSIINAHRGTIKLYSESGKGTTFTVKIPLTQDKAKVKAAASAVPEPVAPVLTSGSAEEKTSRAEKSLAKEKAGEKHSDKSADKSVEKSPVKSPAKSAEKSPVKSPAKSAEKSTEKPADIRKA